MRCILGSLLIVAIWVAMGVQAVPAPAPARVPVPTKEKSFIIKRVENPRYVRVGSVAVRHVFGKYGWDLPSSLVDDDKDNDRGTPVVKSLDKNNSTSGVHIAAGSHSSSAETQFLVPVTVGGQALVMNLDTGSSDLSVPNGGWDLGPIEAWIDHLLRIGVMCIDGSSAQTSRLVPLKVIPSSIRRRAQPSNRSTERRSTSNMAIGAGLRVRWESMRSISAEPRSVSKH